MIDNNKDSGLNHSSDDKMDLVNGDSSMNIDEQETFGRLTKDIRDEDVVSVYNPISQIDDEVEEDEEQDGEELENEEESIVEEVEDEEEISEESVDEVEINTEYPPSIPEVESSGSVENTYTPSLDMEDDGYEVDTEIDEYGNVVEVFSRSVSQATARSIRTIDPRIPEDVKKSSGTISQFGQTVGSVHANFESTATTVHERHKFQGVAKGAFFLTGGILDARATYTVACGFKSDMNTISYESTSATNTLRELMIKAANEKINDINGVRLQSGIPDMTNRANLVLGLRSLFDANAYSATSNVPSLVFGFRETDAVSPKQVSIEFVSTVIFDTSVDNVRNIISENSLINNLSTNKNSTNLNAEAIAVNFDIKAKTPESGLKTNTNYEFIGLNKEVSFYPEASVVNKVHYLEGFNMTNFKTSKKVPYFETLSVVDNVSSMVPSGMIAFAEFASTASIVSSVDFNSLNSTMFLDYDNMISIAASNVSLRVGGTTIKFNTIKIYDIDSTITKIEMEDDRADKYPVSLMPISEKNPKEGANIQVTGLQRSTPYTFRKLHVTAKPDGTAITKTFTLATLSATGDTATAFPNHSNVIRTTAFSEPKLFIEIEEDKKFVSTVTGSFVSTATQSEVDIYMPKLDVELPNKIKMPAVKNDKTALRYVIEVEKIDVTINDLTINGLKGEEKYKVEKVEGKARDYFIVTLYNLSEKRDYGFVILELSYTDIDGRTLVTRQDLNKINIVKNLNIGSSTASAVLTQYPGTNLDNTTGPELTGNDMFNVTLFDAATLEPRKAEIPVFIDDINGRFLRIEFNRPDANPEVELKLENSMLKFTNLIPKSEVVYRVDFIWKNAENKEQTLSKYAKISTPQVSAVDVKKTNISTGSNSAEIVFELYSQPKSPISSVTLSDSTLKFTWDNTNLTLRLQDLKANTEYKDLEISFRVQNGLITKHKIDTFKTQEPVTPPTGNVADFVSRIYSSSLGRDPEVEGWKFWVQKLESKELSVTQFIHDLMKQNEFIDRFLSKEDFIDMMYKIVVGREAEEEGKEYWGKKYEEYKLQLPSLADLRIKIAGEMMNENEFKEYVTKIGLKY